MHAAGDLNALPARCLRGNRPVFVVRDLDQMRAVAEVAAAEGCPVTVTTPPGAAAWLGAGWFTAALARCRADVPEADLRASLDAGERAGDVLAALRAGVADVIFVGRADVAARLAALAEVQGARVHRRRPCALNLTARTPTDAAARVRARLRNMRFGAPCASGPLRAQARWAMRAPMSDEQPRLYLIAEAARLTPDALDQAVAGGDVACLLLTGADENARSLVARAQDAGIAVLVPDSADLLDTLDADGLHLGATGGAGATGADVAALRARLGGDSPDGGPILGIACGASRHTAMLAGEAGADYVAFSGRDSSPAAAADPALLDWWQTMMTVPCVAMGDIDLGDVHALAQAGADFVALNESVWDHPDGPATAVAEANKQLARVTRS